MKWFRQGRLGWDCKPRGLNRVKNGQKTQVPNSAHLLSRSLRKL